MMKDTARASKKLHEMLVEIRRPRLVMPEYEVVLKILFGNTRFLLKNAMPELKMAVEAEDELASSDILGRLKAFERKNDLKIGNWELLTMPSYEILSKPDCVRGVLASVISMRESAIMGIDSERQ